MNGLLRTPTVEEQALLEVIWRSYATDGRWPIFQYVEGVLYQEHDGLDATAVMLGCPRVSIGPQGIGQYGWLHLNATSIANPQPDSRCGLTVAGMAMVMAAQLEVDLFLRVLRLLAARERAFVPDPEQVQTVVVTTTDLEEDLARERRVVQAHELRGMAEVLGHEPSTWTSPIQDLPPDGWQVTLSPLLRRYDGAADVPDYITRLVDQIAPVVVRPPLQKVSALALPEALDYLNAIWRVHGGRPLFRISRSEAAARLSHDIATGEEFDTALSALCGILTQVQLPGRTKDATLGDLKNYLRERLTDASADSATSAVDVLRLVVDLRVWRQHHETDSRGQRGMAGLGLRLPAADWNAAWTTVRSRVITAFTVLRDEVEVLNNAEC